MSITILKNIVEASLVPYRQDKLTVTESRPNDNSCYNWGIITGPGCNTQFPPLSLFFRVIWNPVEYTDEIEQEENSNGELIVFYHRKRGTLSFSALVDEDQLNTLQLMTVQDIKELYEILPDGSYGGVYQIQSMTIESADAIDVIRAEISLVIEGADTIINGCCGGLYDGAPFEPCQGDADPASQLFEPQTTVTFVTVTEFTLDASLTTENEINARYRVYRNGVRVNWVDFASLDTTDITRWSYSGQNVHVRSADPLYAGDTLLIVDTETFV